MQLSSNYIVALLNWLLLQPRKRHASDFARIRMIPIGIPRTINITNTPQSENIMTSKKQSPWIPNSPLEPRLGNVGRSIADRWAIRIMIKALHDSDPLLTVSAFVADCCTDIKANVDETLKSELGTEYVAQLNTPALRQDCKNRLRCLLDEMEAIGKGQCS